MRPTWFVGKTPVTIAAVILVLMLGWLISRDLSKVAPALFRRMDPPPRARSSS